VRHKISFLALTDVAKSKSPDNYPLSHLKYSSILPSKLADQSNLLRYPFSVNTT